MILTENGSRKHIGAMCALVVLLLFGSEVVKAQYLYEFGFGGGLSGYSGELSKTPYTSPGYTLGAFYRSNINSRFSISLGLDYGKVGGHTDDVVDTYPSAQGICNLGFLTRFINPEVLLEVNFFPYPNDKSVLNSKNLTPFYFAGVNMVNYKPLSSSTQGDGGTAIGLPFGVGARWIFSEQWGLQLRFKAVKMFTDAFECDIQLDDPFGFGGGGLHRQDWLYTTTLMLTYSFGEDVWNCNCPGGYKRKNRRH